MLETNELENVCDFKTFSAAEGCCAIPLFHGTRMCALQATEEERKRLYAACDSVLSFAKHLLWDCPIDDNRLEDYIKAKNPLFLGVVVSQYKSASYAYGAFYLTTSYPEAINYSNNVGGELGEWAYYQCVGFRDLQIALDGDIAKAAQIVVEEYEKNQNSERIILIYSGVRFGDLCTERGNPFLRQDENGNPDEAYNARSFKALARCKDTDSASNRLAFRLSNPQDYVPMLVRQKDFKEGFSVFTQVKNTEKYIKQKHISI